MVVELDREKLIGEVAKELNILIGKDDPIFACVVLNEIVLAAMIDNAIGRIEPSIRAAEIGIESASEKLDQSILKASGIHEYLNQTITTIWWQFGAIVILIVFTVVMEICLYPAMFLSKQDQQHLARGQAIDSIWNHLDGETKEKIRASVRLNRGGVQN